MAGKAPQLIQQYVTGGDRSLRQWHLLLRRVTFGAALVLMGGSIVSLHWACNLIGLDGYWEPVAWLVPLAMETGMAAVASTATTIRKPPKPGREHQPGGYYISLWVIFSFVMLLAQASNIGHAVVTIAEKDDLPAVIPLTAVYVFAAAFAALFPLGGTLFVHVSGFLRAHGTGARWIEEDAEIVHLQVAPGTPAAPRTQAPRAPRPAQPARAPEALAAQTPRTTGPAPVRTGSDPLREAARALFDQAIAADPFIKPDAARIHREIGSDKNPATTRRWITDWYADHEGELGTARDPMPPLTVVTPEPEPVEEKHEA